MAQRITCATTLHPERAQKYDYCMARERQEKNAAGLTMVAMGILSQGADRIPGRDGLAVSAASTGKYWDTRKAQYGPALWRP